MTRRATYINPILRWGGFSGLSLVSMNSIILLMKKGLNKFNPVQRKLIITINVHSPKWLIRKIEIHLKACATDNRSPYLDFFALCLYNFQLFLSLIIESSTWSSPFKSPIKSMCNWFFLANYWILNINLKYLDKRCCPWEQNFIKATMPCILLRYLSLKKCVLFCFSN
jgi:hypothetical protein